MATNRMQRVEETLRRGIADALLFGNFNDPRLQGVNFTVTGVKVDTELTLARVFVDVLVEGRDRATVLTGLRSAAGAIRRELQGRVQLRRIPELRFEVDESIARGHRIESILSDLQSESSRAPKPEPEQGEGEGQGGEGDAS
jgi:ribosome-binding factor A